MPALLFILPAIGGLMVVIALVTIFFIVSGGKGKKGESLREKEKTIS